MRQERRKVLIPVRIITSRLKRWRTAHGFGVHSPFAYYFITRVLRERLPYYDFDLLPPICRDEIRRNHARMLFRLVAFFKPDTVYVTGTHADTAMAIVTLAHPSARRESAPCRAQMAIYAGGVADHAEPGREVTVTFGADAVKALRALPSPAAGMTFHNSKAAVTVIRHGLPSQSYLLKF